MARTRTALAATLAAAAVLSLPGLVSEAPTTQASWTEANSWTPPATRSAVFAVAATGASTSVTDTQDANLSTPYNRAGQAVQNLSTTLRADLGYTSFSARLLKRISPSPVAATTSENKLFANTKVSLARSNAADCTDTSAWTPDAWTFGTNTVGNLGTAATYATTRAWASMGAAGQVAPGATKSACVAVAENAASNTREGRRDWLLAHAGRIIGFTLGGEARTSANATWSAPFTGPEQYYRVAAPAPTSDGRYTATNCVAGVYGAVRWGWPSKTEVETTSWTTNAISNWVLMKRVEGQTTFTEWRPQASTKRAAASLPSGEINNDDGFWGITGKWAQVYVRGYLYSDKSAYVNSDFTVWVRERNDAFDCGTGVASNGKPNTETNTLGGTDAPGVHGL